MLTAKVTTGGKTRWQELRLNDVYVASVWGEAEVRWVKETRHYHIIIRLQGAIIAFFHVQEVEYVT